MNKYKRRRLLALIPLLLIVVFIVFRTKSPLRPSYQVKYPVRMEYLDKIDTKAYLILDEIVYTASDSGVVDYELGDGTKVAKDTKVASLSLTNDDQDLKDELLRVQSAIEYKNQSSKTGDRTYQINDQDINLLSSIQKSLNTHSMNDTLDAIEALELNTKKNIDISEISELINLSNQELEDRKDELSREISVSNIAYRASEAGIVSYNIDGLEDDFSTSKIDQMDIAYLKERDGGKDPIRTTSVDQGQPIFKVINNFSYHLAVAIEGETKEKFAKDDQISLVLDDNSSLNGKIVQINKDDQGMVLIVESDEKLAELESTRVHQVSIIKDKIDTYLVDSTSVVEEDGQLGVYTKGLNGLVDFVPVDIFLQRENETLVYTGDSQGTIETKDQERQKTITIYDEVILNPVNLRKGQIIR